MFVWSWPTLIALMARLVSFVSVWLGPMAAGAASSGHFHIVASDLKSQRRTKGASSTFPTPLL